MLEHRVLKYKDRVVFEKITRSVFHRVPKFYHDDEACFMFVNEGEFSVRTPDEFLTYNKEKGLLAKCFDYFFEMDRSQKESNERVEVLGILLYPSMVEEIFQFEILSSTHVVGFDAKQIQVDELLNNFKDSVNILLDNPELADEQMIKTKIREFILLLSKTIKASSHLDFLSAMFKKNDRDFKVVIMNNMYSTLSIKEFAHLCGMSLSSFKRKFSEVFSESPKKYLDRMKLDKASKLLSNRTLRISDIAYDCGYETISTFNRLFKAYSGRSPSEFRLSLSA